jgi:7-dehydrocholesterol reductase
MHDRAGFYICWGCLVWVPGFYTLSSGYLAENPVHLTNITAMIILVGGVFCILINYFADRQRQLFRHKQGNCKIWGKAPKIIRASFQCEDGKIMENLLLASGWWGISRHFHYLPELGAAFLWSLPALFTHLIPYLYVFFLGVLLLERAFRDDKRCRLKYGKFWDAYCQLVPYKIIPFLI